MEKKPRPVWSSCTFCVDVSFTHLGPGDKPTVGHLRPCWPSDDSRRKWVKLRLRLRHTQSETSSCTDCEIEVLVVPNFLSKSPRLVHPVGFSRFMASSWWNHVSMGIHGTKQAWNQAHFLLAGHYGDIINMQRGSLIVRTRAFPIFHSVLRLIGRVKPLSSFGRRGDDRNEWSEDMSRRWFTSRRWSYQAAWRHSSTPAHQRCF